MEAIRTVWEFFQDEILGMAWLNRLIGTTLNTLGLDTSEKIGGWGVIIKVQLRTTQKSDRIEVRKQMV